MNWPDYMRDRCNMCGRYVRLNAPGVAWVQTYSGFDLNDPSYRCSPCTDKFGEMQSNCNPAAGPWSGRNPIEASERNGGKT